jgi:hypothetical protein
VIVQALHETYRFIAPSYGVNIGCVVRHCIASRWLSRRRDVILSVLILVGLWALHLPLPYEVAAFAGALLVALALSSRKLKLRWRIALSVVAYLGIILFARHTLSFLTALLAVLVVAADMYERRYRVVARRMNATKFKPDAPAYGRERPSQRAADERRTAHLADHQDGNVVVYSGYHPFKGSGVDMARWSWSLAIPVTEAIDPAEVYAHVTAEMQHLDVEGSSVTDRFYVNGRYPGRDKELFFHPKDPRDRFPRLRSTISEVSKLEAQPEEMVRRYADIKVPSWQSELILSAFVRFSRTSDYLFIEVSHCVLPPLKVGYYEIHRFNRRPTPHEFFRLLLDSLTALPLLWLRAPLRVAKWMARPITRARWEQEVRQEIRENRRFDYGAVGSIRESGSDSEYGKYFQQTDIERLHKVVDRHLFTVVRSFLQAKGVDTTELERDMRVIVRRAIRTSGEQGPEIR